MKQPTAATKLDSFCTARGIKTADLARKARVSRKHLTAVRRGRVKSPGLEVLSRITAACRRLANADVAIDDLFETTPQAKRKAS